MDSDILILMIAVGASIVSAIVKGSKKKVESRNTLPKENHYDESDPWQGFDDLLEYEDKSAGENTQDSITSSKGLFQDQPEVLVQKVRVNYDDENYISQLMADREATLNRSKLNIKKKKQIKQKTAIDSTPLKTNEHTEQEDITISNFNLKNAILYSEILKPKFNDY